MRISLNRAEPGRTLDLLRQKITFFRNFLSKSIILVTCLFIFNHLRAQTILPDRRRRRRRRSLLRHLLDSAAKAHRDSIRRVRRDSIARFRRDSIARVREDSIAKAGQDSIVKAHQDSIGKSRRDSIARIRTVTAVPKGPPDLPEEIHQAKFKGQSFLPDRRDPVLFRADPHFLRKVFQ